MYQGSWGSCLMKKHLGRESRDTVPLIRRMGPPPPPFPFRKFSDTFEFYELFANDNPGKEPAVLLYHKLKRVTNSFARFKNQISKIVLPKKTFENEEKEEKLGHHLVFDRQ
jgi:hypothetical protein